MLLGKGARILHNGARVLGKGARVLGKEARLLGKGFSLTLWVRGLCYWVRGVLSLPALRLGLQSGAAPLAFVSRHRLLSEKSPGMAQASE